RLPDRAHHVAGHRGEVQQLVRSHLQRRADDLVHVTAGAERTPLPAEDHDAGVVPMRQLGEEVTQIGVRLEGERVELVRAGERDRGDAVGALGPEVLPGVGERDGSAERAHRRTPVVVLTVVANTAYLSNRTPATHRFFADSW